MKKKILLLLLVACISVNLFAQTNLDEHNPTSYIIEDFDTDTGSRDWIVVGSAESVAPYPKVAYASARPRQLKMTEEEGKDYKVLGVASKFKRRGYNFVDIFPVRKGSSPDAKEYEPLRLDGHCEELTMWVWGSNFDYDLVIYLRDYNGIIHALNPVKLNFAGWKLVKFPIPKSIPQLVKEFPQEKFLEIVKLAVKTTPFARVDMFYVYFDEIKVVANTYKAQFDGLEFLDRENIEEIWGTEE